MPNIIHPSAKIGNGTRLGELIIIESDVKIGQNCQIGHQVIIRSGSIIGDNVRIDEHSVIGKMPMKAAFSAIGGATNPLPPAEIGSNAIIGAGVIIYTGAKIGPYVLVADLATVREDVTIGDYTIIGRGVTVENKVSIGSKCKIETEAYICALSSIADGCFVAPEVTFTNDNFLARTKERFKYHKGVTMLKGARIGANATILPGVTIGEDGLVAAGSVVTKDVPSKMIVKGTPARPTKPVPPEQWLENQ
ncbi:MAG: DapH/DapD/GlmU-related protein [Planctomycetota bacterium]